MMSRKALILVLTIASAFVATGTASAATPITVGDGWHTFTWSGGNGAGAAQDPYVFVASGFARVTVTDAFCAGDVFFLTDWGQRLGSTSAVRVDPTCSAPYADNPEGALMDRSNSKGKFMLKPGLHSIEITAAVSPFGGGAAFLRVDPVFGP